MEKFEFIPAEQRVLILPEENEKKIGNIFVPESAQQEKPRFGIITEAGTGNKDIPMKYLKGQRVVFSQYSGVEVELNLDGTNKKYLIMNQMDVMGVIRKIS